MSEGLVLQVKALVSSVSGSLHSGPRVGLAPSFLLRLPGAPLSPVVMYHGLARRYLSPSGFLMRPLLNGGTLGRLHRLGEFLLLRMEIVTPSLTVLVVVSAM